MKKTLLLAATLALVACDKKAEQAPGAPATEVTQAGQDKQADRAARRAARKARREARRAERGAVPGAAQLDPAALLTEEKLKGFITYHQAIAQVAGDAVGMAGKAMAKSGGDQEKMQRAMARDERRKRVAAAGKEALEKSGMIQREISALSNVLVGYYTKRMFAVDAKEAQAKQQGGVFGEMHKKQIEEGEAARAEFEKTYGKEALALVDAHEKEYLAVQKTMMDNVFKKRRKR